MFRQVVLGLLTLALGIPASRPAGGFQNATPATRPPADIPFARLTADAVVPVALGPGSVGSSDAIWVPNRGAGTVVRINAKDNGLSPPINVGAQPCASLVVAFDSVWVPLCGDSAFARVDVKASKLTATFKTTVPGGDGQIATGVGSIWVITDRKGVLSRVDPDTNVSVAEIYVTGGATAVAFGEDALWITSEDGKPSTGLSAGRLTRVNPHNNEIVEVIEAGPKPGRLTVGEGGVWTLNRGNGTVTRVDPVTNKVVATIAIGEGVAEGEIAAGSGSVWISAPGVPIIRIDPRTNRAMQRFTGQGGGAILVAHGSIWVAAGPQITWRLDPALVSTTRP
jgi:YVTN family beta-propeller protein